MPGKQLLCLTITGYRKPGLGDEEYREYMTKKHAPLVSGLMEQYGIIRYSMVRISETEKAYSGLIIFQTHNDSKTKPMLFQLYDPQFSHLSDYDCIVQFVFEKVEDFQRMKADPYFLEKVAPDHVNFADTQRST
jgi:hypothetical protein